MFYILYEIKNNINGKIYVGVHKTKCLNDGYMGSGKVIMYAIAKYGIENFTKTVLETFANEELMFNREREIVTDEFLLREDVYNLRRGGSGGFDYINKCTDEQYFNLRSQNGSRVNSKTRATKNFGPKYGEDNYFYGVKTKSNFSNNPELHQLAIVNATSVAAKNNRKVTFEKIKHQQGEHNSQFGKFWITDGINSMRVKLNESIPDGWKRGRKMPTIVK